MPRTVDEGAHTARRNEILDAAQRLIYAKGYQQMTVQDLLDALGMSKGAFYHYFDSKPALLAALVDRLVEQGVAVMLPIARDPHLGALTKFERLFTSVSQWKTVRKADLLALMPVILSDDNAIFYQKAHAQAYAQVGPLLGEVIRQGMREGVMHAAVPELAGQAVLALLQGLQDALLGMIATRMPQLDSSFVFAPGEFSRLIRAYQEAIERVLGAPPGSLPLVDDMTIRVWEAPADATTPAPTNASPRS